MPRRTKQQEDYLDMVAWVTRATLSYGRSSVPARGMPLHPNSRCLHLDGLIAIPSLLQGFKLSCFLFAWEPLPDVHTGPPPNSVASLQKRGTEVQITARVAPDFVPTLSAAYHDGRLTLLSGRGSKLLRGKSLFTSISFDHHEHFEEGWGEPIPRLKLRPVA